MTITTPLLPDEPAFDASRRALLRGGAAAAGAFLLGTFVPFGSRARGAGEPVPGIYDPNVFLRIGRNSLVTVLIKHFEMGQGVTTGLATLVAEELEADWSQIRFEFAPNDAKLYNNLIFRTMQATGQTTSIANSWEQMRKVGAAARMMFLTAAAARWNVPVREVAIAGGIVRHGRSGRQARLGDLAAAAMRVPVPGEVTLKPSAQWKLIGKRIPRIDSGPKTTGAAMFALDVRRPGMLVAMVKRPDRFGATVASFDAAEAQRVPGVVDVVQIPSGIAVVARDTWSAMRGREALKVTWDARSAEQRSTGDILAEYRRMLDGRGIDALTRGDANAALAGAARTVEAEFTFPYLAHAPMEPLNAVIERRGDGAEIWSGCQAPSLDQLVAARGLGLAPEQIKINTLLGGGSFGRRAIATGSWAAEYAALARALDGRAPVQLVWTREDDIKGGHYRPMALHRVRAGLDAHGRIAGWAHKVAGRGVFVGTAVERLYVRDGIDESMVEGLRDTPYALGSFHLEVFNAQSPVPLLWWRSVGHSYNAHVVETIVDELAHLAGRDPVAFRLDLLQKQPRDAAVLRLAAERAGWGQRLSAGTGRGVAVHASFNTRVAMVADVSVARGGIKVDRVVAAVDCGIAVNPDIVVAQIEGAIGFALSSVLRNEITLSGGIVDQSNFDDFQPTRMSEMPKVEVHIVASDAPPSGIGEPGVPPLAPAIGNAVFAASGKRLRSLPFDTRLLG